MAIPTPTGSMYLYTGRGPEAVEALEGAFAPFGSLNGPGQADLAGAMVFWVDAGPDQDVQAALAGALVSLTVAADVEHSSTIELGRWSVVLRTPTSGTVIELRASARSYVVSIDFGPGGSVGRAADIRRARPGVAWEARP